MEHADTATAPTPQIGTKPPEDRPAVPTRGAGTALLAKVVRKVSELPMFAEATRYHRGGVLANRLGLQVVRVLAKHAAWRLTPRRVSADVRPYVEQLDRDGIAVIPNFLPPEQFAEVKQDFERSLGPAYQKRYERKLIDGLVLDRANLSRAPSDFPAIKRYVEENPTIYGMVSGVLRCRTKYTTPVWTEIFHCPDPSAPNVDTQNVLHADVHYPTVKLWLYIDDVDESNAAYFYARGSHRMTLARLLHEYDMSVRETLMDKGRSGAIPADLIDRGRNRVKDVHRSRMGIRETQYCAKANTLVMSNNCGFHKRGVFSTTHRRAALLMSFRHVDSWQYKIYPVFGLLDRPKSATGRVPA
jgi:hypothetical protein